MPIDSCKLWESLVSSISRKVKQVALGLGKENIPKNAPRKAKKLRAFVEAEIQYQPIALFLRYLRVQPKDRSASQIG
jgi:hypothetical protein